MNGIKPLARCMAVAFGGSMVLLSGSVYAQQATDQPATQKQERIEVTGSNIKQIAGATAAPVQVMTRDEIDRSGATSVEQLLQKISISTSSGGTVAANASGATTGGISSVSLRGLASTRTLVLINGKRIAPYGAPNDSVSVDVDSIPLAAIERVEVLKDGASAIYGSDAVAGVVNFILRRDYTGAEVSAGYGQAYDGKAKDQKVSAVAGFGDLGKDKYNVMIMANYQKDDPLYGRDRTFANTVINFAENNFSPSSAPFPANITIPGVGLRNPMAPNCSPSSFVPNLSSARCYFDFGPFVALLPAIERKGVMASGRILVSDALELYADASYTQKKAQTIIQPVPIGSIFGTPVTLTSTSPYYPTAYVQSQTGGATPNLDVRYRNFIGGNRDLTDTSDATRLVLGGKGTVGAWDYDGSYLYTKSEVTEVLNGGFPRLYGNTGVNPNTGLAGDPSGPGIVPLLSSGQVNLFGPNSQAIIDQIKATNFNATAFKTNTSISSLQGKVSRELMQMQGGSLAVALGAEYRREGYKIDPNPALGLGDISGYGGNFVKLDSKRNVTAAFAEFSVPVLQTLEIDPAIRYDSYAKSSNPNDVNAQLALLGIPGLNASNIGTSAIGDAPSFSKVTGKLGIRWQPAKELLVRSTVGTAYRAPSLTDLYQPLQSGVTGGLNDPARCVGTNNKNPNDCGAQFNQFSGGNPQLKPEEATTATLGLVVEPNNDASFGANYFFYRIKNLIGVLTPDYLLANEASFPGKIIRGPADTTTIPGTTLPGAIIAINQTNTNTDKAYIAGVDIDAKYRIHAGEAGRFTARWNATYYQRWDAQNPDGSYSSSIDTASSFTSGIIPRLRHTLAIDWDRGPWGATVGYNWQGSYTDLCGNQDGNCVTNGGANPPRKVGAYETWDLQGTYAGLKDLKLTLGAKNIFNRNPPYTNAGGVAVFQGGYDPSYTDPRGRFVYVNATYKFR